MDTDRNRIKLESVIHKYAEIDLQDIIVTQEEEDFAIKMYDIIDRLVANKEKVTLPKLSKGLNISTTELYDYIEIIIAYEERSIFKYKYSK